MTRIVLLLGVDNTALVAAARRLLPEGGVPEYWPEMANGGYPTHASKHGVIADRIVASSASMPALVVTHSEVIVLRIRRRVADGSLPADSVLVYWIDEVDSVGTSFRLNEYGTPLNGWLSQNPVIEETVALLRERSIRCRDEGRTR